MPATLRAGGRHGDGRGGGDGPAPALSAAHRLRLNFAATRVGFTWFGVRKTLSPEQKAQAAEPFGADVPFFTAAKKLMDNRHEAFQAVTAVRTQIVGYWKGLSLPYPEPGVRLVRQDEVAPFDQRMAVFRADLGRAVDELDQS